MLKMCKIRVIFVFLMNVPLCRQVELELIDCGIDNAVEVAQGDVEISQYPWLGILYYTYWPPYLISVTDLTQDDQERTSVTINKQLPQHQCSIIHNSCIAVGDVGETRAVTTVALIHKEFVIAVAADIGPMPKRDFRRNSRVLLGEHWTREGHRVRNYVLHPEYGDTLNTVALVQLKDPVRHKDIRPLCPPPERLRDPIFYVMKFKTDYNDLQKQVIPVAHVPADLCREFYIRANLYSRRMRPPHVACAVALDERAPCVWGAGPALAARDAWGRWLLLGIGVRGPGCGAPSRYLDMGSYYPWIEHSLSQFRQITISKMSKQKYVLRGGSSAYQRYGACDEEEKVNLVFRELIRLETDNMQFQFLTYNMTIQENVEYTCLTLELTNASAVSEMRITHLCPRYVDGSPCHYYKGSRFEISVYIMFSDTCMFEMYSWGFKKNMTLLDKQEWKWEEGTYYEDFSATRPEYRGQTYMTEFGYEPLDDKVWVPEYDIWTTTAFDNSSWSSTTPLPKKDGDEEEGKGAPTSYIYIPTQGTPTTTTATTARHTRRYFRIKSTRTPRTTTRWEDFTTEDENATTTTDNSTDPDAIKKIINCKKSTDCPLSCGCAHPQDDAEGICMNYKTEQPCYA